MSGRGTPNSVAEQLASPDVQSMLDLLEAVPSRSMLIQILTRRIGLEVEELARLGGFNADAIAQWDAKDNPPAAERLDDLADIVALLMRDVGLSPASITGWLRSRNRALDQQRPLDVLRLGGYLRTAEAVDALRHA
jgi:transcriptional regulator with XRE-family HTH domain